MDDLTGERHSILRQYLMLMWAGGVSGQMSWLVAYPWEVVKTHIQCETKFQQTMRNVIREGYRQEGVPFFFKGLLPTLFRTFMCNAIVLPTFELINRSFINSHQP